ncbi:carboxymuconolactone decarboxylase family protein [Dyadobacter sp. CY345]|uniref:carboxymuconolactone decarboxylase family protein n=1 Tax=Dyadobacter sp. CY345 TaxID=2909335 RepID=UPI001F2E5E69|nr:carboxymuconolactone decarboxylase family protein [Dyadobacter sp. CY345]MCF2446658.1 carboxymuconolactone decarboxylase family protein [Dyadobacter sp. CY345]
MKTIQVPGYDQVRPEAQLLFDQLKKQLGKVPNLYAAMGYSASTLKGFLDFENALSKSVFTPKEREAINLVVSEVNSCNYCLAAHTMIGTMKGFTNDEILGFRNADAANSKLNTVLHLAKSITENKGAADQSLIEDFFNAGYNEAALVELVGLITAKIFTNYIYALTSVPIDFPEVAALSKIY